MLKNDCLRAKQQNEHSTRNRIRFLRAWSRRIEYKRGRRQHVRLRHKRKLLIKAKGRARNKTCLFFVVSRFTTELSHWQSPSKAANLAAFCTTKSRYTKERKKERFKKKYAKIMAKKSFEFCIIFSASKSWPWVNVGLRDLEPVLIRCINLSLLSLKIQKLKVSSSATL